MRLASNESRVEALFVRTQLLEQRADLVGDEGLVGEPADGSELLRARLAAERRHLRLLVPREERATS